MVPTRKVEFVLKISKLCNLRCRYCYEYASLADPQAMSREQLATIYQRIFDHYVALDARDGAKTELTFIWHGGEPLLRPPAYFYDTFADQRRIFGDAYTYSNIVQTNLTVLDDARVALLRDAFDMVGVSVDLFGGLRVDVAGKSRQSQVLANLDRLRREKVPFGAIVVFTRANLERLDEIYTFFERAGLPFRLLPLFDGAFEDQHAGFEVTTAEVVSAFTRLYDRWSASSGPRIDPVYSLAATALDHLAGRKVARFDKRRWLPVMLINTNGDCYSYGDPYGDPAWSLGNVLQTSLTEVFASEAFERSCAAADARMAANCTRCPYSASCSGYAIADEHYNCRETTPEGVRACVVEPAVFEHIVARLSEHAGVRQVMADASPGAR